ncbi:MAG: hypothetical protein PVJ57_11725 [Phycisphaerae bacterium]|jgi:magnesium transporter
MPTMDILSRAELHDAWPALSPQERQEGFNLLPRAEAEELFVALDAHDQRRRRRQDNKVR